MTVHVRRLAANIVPEAPAAADACEHCRAPLVERSPRGGYVIHGGSRTLWHHNGMMLMACPRCRRKTRPPRPVDDSGDSTAKPSA